MSRFAEELIIQSCVNVTGKCVHYVRDEIICRNIDYQELLKFSQNCVDHMYRMFGFA